MIRFEPVYSQHLSMSARGAHTSSNFFHWLRMVHRRCKSRQQIRREIRYRRTPAKASHVKFLRKMRSYGAGPF